MPGRLRHLSGPEVVRILESFGFESHSQRGDHVKLRRVIESARQTLVVPLHRELDLGTLQALYRQASSYIAVEKLRPHLYID